jgi:hypothetical protein
MNIFQRFFYFFLLGVGAYCVFFNDNHNKWVTSIGYFSLSFIIIIPTYLSWKQQREND